MNITIRGGEPKSVSLFQYIQIQKEKILPHGLEHTDSGLFQFEESTYCLVGESAKGCLMQVPDNHVVVFNLDSQTIRQVALATWVTPVQGELTIYDPYSNAPECR